MWLRAFVIARQLREKPKPRVPNLKQIQNYNDKNVANAEEMAKQIDNNQQLGA